MRIALGLEYDGASFHGWQSQADGSGVQVYYTFYFSALDINMTKSPTLMRAVTLYGATGGLRFWRYTPSLTQWSTQTL